MLKQFFVNPGFSHIGESICMKLNWSDHKSLVSLKEEYNSDFLNKSSFWLKKCEYPEILNQSVNQSWKDLSKEIKINTNSQIGTNNNLESTFVTMLIKIHENPFKYDKSSPLHLACELGDIKMVKFILKTWDITCHQSKLDFQKDRYDHTPILIAASAGYEKIVKLLIPFYENPRVKAITGWSALTLAAINGHLEIVKLLSYDMKLDEEDIQDLIHARFYAFKDNHRSVIHYCNMKLENYERFGNYGDQEKEKREFSTSPENSDFIWDLISDHSKDENIPRHLSSSPDEGDQEEEEHQFSANAEDCDFIWNLIDHDFHDVKIYYSSYYLLNF